MVAQRDMTMYERFTDRARKTMQYAKQEARGLNHECIGTEHILIGLIQEGGGVAAHVLQKRSVSLTQLRDEVEQHVRPNTECSPVGEISFTPAAKKVIEYAFEEAKGLGHNYIGTEHLLLGLIREGEGLAANALTKFDVKLDDMREEMRSLLARSHVKSKQAVRVVLKRKDGTEVQIVPLESDVEEGRVTRDS